MEGSHLFPFVDVNSAPSNLFRTCINKLFNLCSQALNNVRELDSLKETNRRKEKRKVDVVRENAGLRKKAENLERFLNTEPVERSLPVTVFKPYAAKIINRSINRSRISKQFS